jgi:UDP-3-O-[3-hydroxymyristoyl] glucosamine N-acyltransferase
VTGRSITAQAVADLVGGRLSGNGAAVLAGAAPLDSAGPGDLSLFGSPRYLPQFRASRAGCVLMSARFADQPGGPATRIVVEDPQRALGLVMAHLLPVPAAPAGVHPSAILGRGTRLGDGVSIGAGVVVGEDCRIGDRSILGPGVILEDAVVIGPDATLGPRVVCHHHVVLGARVIVKAGAVIGGTGFGYISSASGHERIPHGGGCRLEDDVDVGANSTIDRGSVGDTVIGRGSKLDNLVHVAHNVRIGEHCLVMAGVGIAGSTRVGNRVVLAGQVGVAGHITLGDDVRVGAQSGVTGSVPAGLEVSGYPARAHREQLRALGALYRLAPLARRLERLVRERPEDA